MGHIIPAKVLVALMSLEKATRRLLPPKMAPDWAPNVHTSGPTHWSTCGGTPQARLELWSR